MPELYWVDAFSDGPFTGNPACVLLQDRPVSEAWVRALARELGVSETALVAPFLSEGATLAWKLRWFTPAGVEMKLCGHATLAAAHALWESGRLPEDEEALFATLGGELRARREGELIALDFPAVEVEERTAPVELADALGLDRVRACARAGDDWLVELDDEETVQKLYPDMGRLAQLGPRGVIVTAPSAAPGAEFVSRFFAPAVGINEDPATGSAHCALGPWWGRKFGKKKLSGRQLSSRRGWIAVELKGGRVCLTGQAFTLMRGYVQFPAL